jgi:transcriptional regulator with XRE-family HTH domain
MPTSSQRFAEEVRAVMARKLRQQGDLADHLGVSRETVNRWLTGRVRWPLDEAIATAEWLEVPLGSLVTPPVAVVPA